MTERRQLVLGTRNKGKLRELRFLLSDLPLELLELKHFSFISDVPETGETFLENACRKAIGYAMQTGLLTIADDSGLEVDALGGQPGVRSARYGGEGASDAERTAKVLNEISSITEGHRAARFVSIVAVADEQAEIVKVATGVCEGQLARSARGTGGFGYDPIFIPNGYDATFGELAPAIKNRISHRARALTQVHDFLRSLTGLSTAG